MTSFLFKNHSTRIFGVTLSLLGTAVAPSQATSLTGFSTYGNMMSGMQVTANFLDGTFQRSIWGDRGNRSGGAIGSGWSLTQSGNSYESPWTFSNSGQGITSLIIDAIPGNTVFDTYPLLDGPLQTPNSAEGWEFQTTSGQRPTSYTYTDPIDISRGDLFGKLSLYWNNGFAGVMQFRADTDSGSGRDPVRPRNPGVRDAPPTVSFSAPTIYEGQSASTSIYATDPEQEAITFFLNGSNLGTDFSRGGTRSAIADLGFFADNGDYTYTAQARDEDGNYSSSVTSTLTVLNVAPTVTSLNIPTIYEGQSAAAEMSATDPGADSISFFLNDTFVGTDPNTSGTRAVGANLGYFADNTYIPYTGYALDKDGAWSAPAYSGLTVLNVAPTVTNLYIPTIYEGQSASAYISATDPGADSISFFLNDTFVGTDPNTSGTRSLSPNLGFFADNTYIPYTGYALDKDGDWSTPAYSGLTVLNLPPTLTDFNLSSDTIYQGQSVSASLYATDPGADSINFFVNGSYVGVDPITSGIRSVGTNLGTFTDVGDYTFTGLAQDKDSAFSNPLIRTLKVLNVAPTITQLTENLIVKQNELFDFAAAAIDPGIHDLLTFDWDFNMDGVFDDFIGASGQWFFEEEGTHQIGLLVSDGKGGYTSGSFTVEVEKVPEPGSVLGVLAFGAFGAGAVLRRKHQKAETHNLN